MAEDHRFEKGIAGQTVCPVGPVQATSPQAKTPGMLRFPAGVDGDTPALVVGRRGQRELVAGDVQPNSRQRA